MKGKKEHHEAEEDRLGLDEAEEDLKSKPERYDEGRPENEAEERKSGGRTKRMHGGKTEEKREDKKEDEKKKRDHKRRKHGGKMVEMHGEKKEHKGRMPRKSGGRTYSDSNPFTSAHKGTAATGRKLEKETMD